MEALVCPNIDSVIKHVIENTLRSMLRSGDVCVCVCVCVCVLACFIQLLVIEGLIRAGGGGLLSDGR